MSRSTPDRPHVLGIDEGPVDKHRASGRTPLVGVTMEGADLVEAVAITEFPVDGDEVTAFLGDWIESLRIRPVLQAVLFGGITVAGLGVLDPIALAARLGLPVVVVNRRAPENTRLEQAMRAAGLAERIAVLRRAPPANVLEGGLHASAAGIDPAGAAALIERTRRKSRLPEPLRLAHLVARAVATGESRGRP